MQTRCRAAQYWGCSKTRHLGSRAVAVSNPKPQLCSPQLLAGTTAGVVALLAPGGAGVTPGKTCMEDERCGTAHTLCGQSWPCEGRAIAADMLGEESSLSTTLGAHQLANCVCGSRAEAARPVDAVLRSLLILQLAPGDANRWAKIHWSAVPLRAADLL